MTTNNDVARVEIRCTSDEKRRMRENAAADGYPDRAFAAWARARLLNEYIEPSVAEAPRNKMLSVTEAATYCGVSRQQVYTWINSEQLLAQTLPEGIRVFVRDLKPFKRGG